MKKIIVIRVEQHRKEYNPVRKHLYENKAKVIPSKRIYNRKKVKYV